MPRSSASFVPALASVLFVAVLFVAADADAAREDRGELTEQPADHTAFGLCGTANIHPVAAFDRQYTDPVGNHYHGWIPPAGPPYFILCLTSESLAPAWP